MVLVSSLRPPQDLPSLCTIVVSTLWVQYHPSSTKAVQQQLWDDARRLEFHTYCQSILSYLNISPSVIYTSLKYVQNYLSSLPTSIRTTLAYGSERAIFVIALLLAYKFVEDCGSVDTNYWSQASMIPISALRKMEIDFLCQVDHKLHVDKPAFVGWVTQCNATFEQSLYLCTMSSNNSIYSFQLPDKLYHPPCYDTTTTPPTTTMMMMMPTVSDSATTLLHPAPTTFVYPPPPSCYYYSWHDHHDGSWHNPQHLLYPDDHISFASSPPDSCNFMGYGTYPEMGPYFALPPMPMQ
ncbi:predicted protein [Lichtheimia corymbifera JMRC:FSU:9682]|uniref:Cyclin N-terminal domain-containing protein n=1 Tax=Lichtheimia corymbifera JMRC:FSU:9682 TaxID=1263082 RepID=A0A068S6C7_9FUNG|nr:predicted protein [Lichtheimia corymbifera JMRC:FSU:9682]